jgi:hypothetical protein
LPTSETDSTSSSMPPSRSRPILRSVSSSITAPHGAQTVEPTPQATPDPRRIRLGIAPV